MPSIYAFLDCGIPENGMARVRCDDCGTDFFVSFSCHQRGVCPSCTTKRSILFGEKIGEIVKPISHLHITFTIPKILRAYFRRNRKLLKHLAQSANFAIEEYFRKAMSEKNGFTGGIFCIQSQGSLFNYHPHLHGLIIAGLIKDGVFYEHKNISTQIIAEIFRARLLAVLLSKGVITQELINMLISWNHNSGFNVHTEGKVTGSDGTAIENISRYITRAPLSTERIEFNSDNSTVTVYEKQNKSNSENFAVYNILEFMALLASHIPSRYETVTYYYGVYSSSHRGKEKREETEEQEIAVTVVMCEKNTDKGKPTQTWARLIRKIFEINPLTCKKCGGKMRIIAFITSKIEIKKILKHIGQETRRPPPLHPVFHEREERKNLSGDYIPNYDDYCRDEMYETP